MQFDFESMTVLERYRLLLATVLPRPIAWVTTRGAAGAINAAPFSFFNVFGSDPATVGIGIRGCSRTRFEMAAIALEDWKRKESHERVADQSSRCARRSGALA